MCQLTDAPNPVFQRVQMNMHIPGCLYLVAASPDIIPEGGEKFCSMQSVIFLQNGDGRMEQLTGDGIIAQRQDQMRKCHILTETDAGAWFGSKGKGSLAVSSWKFQQIQDRKGDANGNIVSWQFIF